MKLGQKDSPHSDDERAEMAKIPYASAIGSLMYAMVATRPDIAFAVGVSRYMATPGKKHWEAVKGIMRYVKGTMHVCICFGKKDLVLHGFIDSDFARCRPKKVYYKICFHLRWWCYFMDLSVAEMCCFIYHKGSCTVIVRVLFS